MADQDPVATVLSAGQEFPDGFAAEEAPRGLGEAKGQEEAPSETELVRRMCESIPELDDSEGGEIGDVAKDATAVLEHQDYSCGVWGLDMRHCGFSAEGRAMLRELVEDYADLFSGPTKEVGRFAGVELELDTQGNAPIKQRAYEASPAKQEIIEAEVKRMLALGIIRPSRSPWASPCVVLTKPDGSYRFCVDYRLPNTITKGDAYPSPLMSGLIGLMGSSRYFTSLDLTSGYWQIPVKEEDKEKTAIADYSSLTACRSG
jgi:hypothetical protein